MCVGAKLVDGDGGPQQIQSMTPFQAVMGQGHLRGMSPGERTNVAATVGSGVRGAMGLVPMVGPAYQAASNAANGDYKGAALNVGAAVLGPVPRAFPLLLRSIAQAQDAGDIAGAAVGIGSNK